MHLGRGIVEERIPKLLYKAAKDLGTYYGVG